MALVGHGRPIPGASPESGRRLCFVDGEVEKATGHKIEYPIWFRPQPEEEPEPEVRKRSAKGTFAKEEPDGAQPIEEGNAA
jgi:hypothetical protein